MMLALLLIPVPFLGYKVMDAVDRFLEGVHRR